MYFKSTDINSLEQTLKGWAKLNTFYSHFIPTCAP